MMTRISLSKQMMRGFGSFAKVPTTPPDPILGINEKFKECTDSKKVNLTVGAYRDENGKPWILPSVRQAMKKVYENTNEIEYIPIIGDKEFIKLALQVAYGKASPALKDNRVAGAQVLSGCGGLYMGMQFLKKFWPHSNELVIHTSNPTWPIHNTMTEFLGVKNEVYPYYDPKTKGLDFEGMTGYLNKLPERSIVMLHSCAHNPTGVDPTPQQWKQILEIFEKRKLFAFFDMAYQGFATGELEQDNLSLRLWVEKGLEFCCTQSFAKSMGMYGQRLGAFSLVCDNSAEARQVESQLATIARNTWSSPPRYGSDVAKVVLGDSAVYNQWLEDMRLMSGRILNMRKALRTNLEQLGNPHKWNHVTDQIGMFAYTGMTKEMCQQLIDKYSIYLTMNGRISVAGLNEKNVDYVSKAFDEVTRNSKF